MGLVARKGAVHCREQERGIEPLIVGCPLPVPVAMQACVRRVVEDRRRRVVPVVPLSSRRPPVSVAAISGLQAGDTLETGKRLEHAGSSSQIPACRRRPGVAGWHRSRSPPCARRCRPTGRAGRQQRRGAGPGRRCPAGTARSRDCPHDRNRPGNQGVRAIVGRVRDRRQPCRRARASTPSARRRGVTKPTASSSKGYGPGSGHREPVSIGRGSTRSGSHSFVPPRLVPASRSWVTPPCRRRSWSSPARRRTSGGRRCCASMSSMGGTSDDQCRSSGSRVRRARGDVQRHVAQFEHEITSFTCVEADHGLQGRGSVPRSTLLASGAPVQRTCRSPAARVQVPSRRWTSSSAAAPYS